MMVMSSVVLAVGLLAAALLGPRLLRRAAPTLARVPRLAVFILFGGILMWIAALFAMGPLIAWFVSGPSLLPEEAAAVCQRCLVSASPFGEAVLETSLPVVALLVAPTLAGAALLGGALLELRRRARVTSTAADLLRADAELTSVHGYRVLLIRDSRPFAFALPSGHGRIILSDAALAQLTRTELISVLEHEAAHLRQRHHLIVATVAATTRYLRWIPLIAAASDALPHYLEIAADDAARTRTGTPALAAALLKLGSPTHP
ncbi:M56 family metallopeptidase, partial [Sediminivirga luteola]|uniref:M56 family metallopeptidase n=1 Tax=Sediminivirga luteola TaxID=1774748 RepID=UPI001F59150B